MAVGRGTNHKKFLYIANYLQVPWEWMDSLAQPKHWKKDSEIWHVECQ
jgi:hypothetical protein